MNSNANQAMQQLWPCGNKNWDILEGEMLVPEKQISQGKARGRNEYGILEMMAK